MNDRGIKKYMLTKDMYYDDGNGRLSKYDINNLLTKEEGIDCLLEKANRYQISYWRRTLKNCETREDIFKAGLEQYGGLYEFAPKGTVIEHFPSHDYVTVGVTKMKGLNEHWERFKEFAVDYAIDIEKLAIVLGVEEEEVLSLINDNIIKHYFFNKKGEYRFYYDEVKKDIINYKSKPLFERLRVPINTRASDIDFWGEFFYYVYNSLEKLNHNETKEYSGIKTNMFKGLNMYHYIKTLRIIIVSNLVNDFKANKLDDDLINAALLELIHLGINVCSEFEDIDFSENAINYYNKTMFPLKTCINNKDIIELGNTKLEELASYDLPDKNILSLETPQGNPLAYNTDDLRYYTKTMVHHYNDRKRFYFDSRTLQRKGNSTFVGKDALKKSNRPNNKTGVVYLAKSKYHPNVKIGYTSNSEQRLVALKAGDPSLYYYYTFPAFAVEERALHKRYRDKQERGEWFNLSNHDINTIISLSETFEVIEEKEVDNHKL